MFTRHHSLVVSSGESGREAKFGDVAGAASGSGDFASIQITALTGIIVENHGTAKGTLTLTDHAVSGKSVVFEIPATNGGSYPIPLGGIDLGAWIGLKATLTGTAQRVRVLFSVS